jgi:hypothetical protein
MLDRIRYQKRIAVDVVAIVSQCYNCCVMGGAPRDWYLGKAAKDIDVFVTCAEPLKGNTFCGFTVTEIAPTETYDNNPNIVAVYETIEDHEKVQFIFTKNAMDWNTFPYSTSKARMLPDGYIDVSRDFLLSHALKIHVSTGVLYANENYAFKMKEYFPDYKIVTKAKAYDYFFN